MGNSQSRSMEVLKYFDKEWEYLTTNSQGVKVYRNRDNDKEAEMHNIAIDPKTNLLKEYDIYNYRRSQDSALVSTYAVQNMKDQAPNMCGDRDCLKVMTESIPIRGPDIRPLSSKEGMYMLSECLRGYNDCYNKVGAFEVNDRMMGLNKNGHVKVWLNEEWAQNHPTLEKPLLQITTSHLFRNNASQQQQHMVGQIVNIVQRKCEGGFPQNFKQRIHNQQNFVDSYHTVENYCVQNQVEIPDRIVMDNVGSYYREQFAPRKEQQQTIYRDRQVVTNEKNQNDNFSFKDYKKTETKVQPIPMTPVNGPIPMTPVAEPIPMRPKEEPIPMQPAVSVSSPSSFYPPQPQQNQNQMMFSPSRDTLINRLPRDTLVSKYQQKQIKIENSNNSFEKSYKSTYNPAPTLTNNYTPPLLKVQNPIRYESSYKYEPFRSTQQQSSMLRAASPPQSPKGINFSYQVNRSPQRQINQPTRTTFVTSQRF